MGGNRIWEICSGEEPCASSEKVKFERSELQDRGTSGVRRHVGNKSYVPLERAIRWIREAADVHRVAQIIKNGVRQRLMFGAIS